VRVFDAVLELVGVTREDIVLEGVVEAVCVLVFEGVMVWVGVIVVVRLGVPDTDFVLEGVFVFEAVMEGVIVCVFVPDTDPVRV
jgi:hypothetical protein